jgi:glycosyltransferase involved in cell wall biosynthesis
MPHEVPPLFSVVIPTYNHGRYIARALQSVFDQTFTNWEVIVVDNYSSDDTDVVVNEFADPRVTYIKIHNNGIIAASRNVGILAANGQWIAFLDSDDWWTSDKLEVCFDSISNNVDLIYHDMDIVPTHFLPLFKPSLKRRQLESPVLIDLLVGGNVISNSSAVVRKSLLVDISGINEARDLIAAEDYNTWLRISRLTDRFLYLPQALGFYFVHNEAISKKDMSIPERRAVSEFLSILNSRQKLVVESRIRYIKGRFSFLSGKAVFADQDLLYCLRYGPMVFKVKCLIMLVFRCFK